MKDNEKIKLFFDEHKQSIDDKGFSGRLFATIDVLPEPKPRYDKTRVIIAIFGVAGALLFLNEEKGQQALLTAADFIYRKCEAGETLSSDELNAVLDTLAGADMLIDNLKNKQPVLQSMFDVALASSEKLKAVA